ncbi:hypothetical protein GCM10027167_64340 [Nocardia heshunensis]
MLVGFYFTSQTLQSTSAANSNLRQSQITDKFTKAIEALNKDTYSQVGAVYTLGQLANDQVDLRSIVTDVIVTFIHAKTDLTNGACDPQKKPAPEVQAALNVIARRTFDLDQLVDLSNTCLPHVNLSGANLQHVIFVASNMHAANLFGAKYSPLPPRATGKAFFEKADLSGATLSGSDLSFFDFTQTNLNGTGLGGVNLTYSEFRDSDLVSASFTGSDLTHSCFIGSDLSGAYFHFPGDSEFRTKNIDLARFVADKHDETHWPTDFTPSVEIDIKESDREAHC